MPPKPTTIDAYIATFPKEIQAVLAQLRRVIREAVPEAVESIRYGMPAFGVGKRYVYLAANKKHAGLYALYGLDEIERELTPYRGKGTKDALHFAYDQPLPLQLIAKVVRHKCRKG